LTINGSQFTIGWGAKPVFTIGWGQGHRSWSAGRRVNEESNDRLEEMADSLVPDEDIMCRAPEHRRTLQLDDEGSSQTRKKPHAQWCPMAWPNPRREESSTYVS
jgi:hypothetical protein